MLMNQENIWYNLLGMHTDRHRRLSENQWYKRHMTVDKGTFDQRRNPHEHNEVLWEAGYLRYYSIQWTEGA